MRHQVIRLRVASVGWWLGSFAAFFVLASIITQSIKYATGYHNIYGIIPLFNLNAECNAPSYFSAVLLLIASALLAVIAIFKRRESAPYALHWTALAGIFLFLSFDEASSIHELLIRPMDESLGDSTRGIFFFSWVIPASIVVVVLAVTYFRFWLHLPPRIRWRVFAAGALFLGGAIGMELLGGRQAELHSQEDPTYVVFTTIEETLEIAGSILFILALLSYLETIYGSLEFRFTPRDESEALPPSDS